MGEFRAVQLLERLKHRVRATKAPPLGKIATRKLRVLLFWALRCMLISLVLSGPVHWIFGIRRGDIRRTVVRFVRRALIVPGRVLVLVGAALALAGWARGLRDRVRRRRPSNGGVEEFKAALALLASEVKEGITKLQNTKPNLEGLRDLSRTVDEGIHAGLDRGLEGLGKDLHTWAQRGPLSPHLKTHSEKSIGWLAEDPAASMTDDVTDEFFDRLRRLKKEQCAYIP